MARVYTPSHIQVTQMYQGPRAGAPSSPWTDAKHQSNERPAPLLACTYPPPPCNISAHRIHTPLSVPRMRKLLLNHPNRPSVQFVMSGLLHGFDIGFRGSRDVNIVDANLSSAAMHPDFVSTYLAKCCKLNELLGPFTSKPFTFSHCSGVGCVPMKSGRLRLIHHLSSPEGESVNDGISREDYSVQYVSIDRAIDAIMRYGTSGQLFKLDVRSAFRIIPVRSEDWPLLGISWQGQYYFDTVLPFGLRSSPAIFNSVAECIEWIIINEFSIPDLLHYLDDFLCISATALLANQHAVILLREFNYLGIPLSAEKVEGPLPVLCFPGIELDCQQLEARLPEPKLHELQSLVTRHSTCRTITQRELESFLGKLSFAARVITPGRTFMRRLWDTCKRYPKSHYRIHLSEDALSDIKWWHRLLSDWNGKSFFLSSRWTPAPDIQLFTDASAWDHRLGCVLRQPVAAGQVVST